MCERAFVLLPLRDIAPDWRHPVSGRGVLELLSELSPGQIIRRMPGEISGLDRAGRFCYQQAQ